MLLHWNTFHLTQLQLGDPIAPAPAPMAPIQGPAFLVHPFSLIVSGPTSYSETNLVYMSLRYGKIHSLPQRIVSPCKRWQPFYDAIKMFGRVTRSWYTQEFGKKYRGFFCSKNQKSGRSGQTDVCGQ